MLDKVSILYTIIIILLIINVSQLIDIESENPAKEKTCDLDDCIKYCTQTHGGYRLATKLVSRCEENVCKCYDVYPYGNKKTEFLLKPNKKKVS